MRAHHSVFIRLHRVKSSMPTDLSSTDLTKPEGIANAAALATVAAVAGVNPTGSSKYNRQLFSQKRVVGEREWLGRVRMLNASLQNRAQTSFSSRSLNVARVGFTGQVADRVGSPDKG